MHLLKSKRQSTLNTQHAQTMTDLKDTLAKFTSALSFQEKGKFPSQPQQNPKGQYNSEIFETFKQLRINIPLFDKKRKLKIKT
jgi:hypothetical protein